MPREYFTADSEAFLCQTMIAQVPDSRMTAFLRLPILGGSYVVPGSYSDECGTVVAEYI